MRRILSAISIKVTPGGMPIDTEAKHMRATPKSLTFSSGLQHALFPEYCKPGIEPREQAASILHRQRVVSRTRKKENQFRVHTGDTTPNLQQGQSILCVFYPITLPRPPFTIPGEVSRTTPFSRCWTQFFNLRAYDDPGRHD